MNPEDVLLWIALLCLLGVAGLRARWLRHRTAAQGPVPRLLGVAALALGVSALVLVGYFLSLRLGVEYVFSYTGVGAPWYYRIAGFWGGQKGTILLWATASAAFLWINARAWRARRNLAPDPEGLDEVLAWVEMLGALLVAAFVGLLLADPLFARTDPYLLAARPEGTGLQPVLRTPFMLIHPPLQFVGYAASTLLFPAGIAAVVTRRAAWADLALPWARIGFVIATAGLGLGGLWAYYVLNFGGYWAWDPVETANLIAWFPLLLLLHATVYFRKRGMFATAAPLYAVLTLLTVLFSAIATRTGLWVSVHAFTDPSRNFAPDPLVRLLNILASGALLQGLATILCVAVLAVLGAYVHRLRADLGSPASAWARAARALYVPAMGLLASTAALAVLDVRFLASAVFEAADLVGFGNAHLGLGVIGFAAALVVASPTLGPAPETAAPRPRRRWLEYVDTARLVFLGVVLLSLAFLVVFLLQVLSVNGYQRSVYDERAPLVALPILLVLPAALAHGFLGRRATVAVALGAAAAGAGLALLFREHWELFLVLPAFAWALFGTSLKLFKVSDLGPIQHRALRVAGGLLLFGGIATMVYWANPPTRLPLGFATLSPSAWWAPVGFGLGLVATLSAVGTLRAATIRAHRFGGVALVLGVGFGLGALMGIAAIVLGERARRRFPDAGAPKPILECAAGLRREVRKTGVYLIHVAIVLGLLGYALSTYAEGPEEPGMLRRDEPVTVHGYELTLVGSEAEGFDEEQGAIEEVHALVEVRRDGRLLHVARLTMWLELYHHYAERVAVQRFAEEDLYLRPVAFVTPEKSFVAHEDNVVLTSGEVEAVAFTAKTLPGMHLVWGSLWMIVAGMLLNLVASGNPWAFSRSKSSGAPRP